MLIDEYIHSFDVNEIHRVEIAASRESVFEALKKTDLSQSGIVRALMILRTLPAALSRRGGMTELASRGSEPVTLASFEDRGFRELGENPPEEIVLGLEGKFWMPSGAVCTPSAEAFRTSAPTPGTARAVWNFSVLQTGANRCSLTTETRVLCADAATRRRFLPYWALIRLGSGIIRRSMLKAVKRAAEAAPITVS